MQDRSGAPWVRKLGHRDHRTRGERSHGLSSAYGGTFDTAQPRALMMDWVSEEGCPLGLRAAKVPT